MATGKTKTRLAKRYNADGTISLIACGRVVFKSNDPRDIQSFAEGWYGSSPMIWNRTLFGRPGWAAAQAVKAPTSGKQF